MCMCMCATTKKAKRERQEGAWYSFLLQKRLFTVDEVRKSRREKVRRMSTLNNYIAIL